MNVAVRPKLTIVLDPARVGVLITREAAKAGISAIRLPDPMGMRNSVTGKAAVWARARGIDLQWNTKPGPSDRGREYRVAYQEGAQHDLMNEFDAFVIATIRQALGVK